MIALLYAISLTPRAVVAQRQDSARVGIKPQTTPAATTPPISSPADTAPRAPMTPRRAFLTSLLIPGYAQTVFGRDHAAMLFTLIEIGSIGMARKAAQDLSEARSLAHDSVVATYKIDPTTGVAAIDPKTGLPIPDTYLASRFTPDRIKARRTHYEDWIAAIIFNHLVSGADAYVAANLWDFNANVRPISQGSTVTVTASLRFR